MHPDWKLESERLDRIILFISDLLKKKIAEKDYLVHQQTDINRSMWEESGAVTDLESISDFMQNIGLLKQNMAWSKQTVKDMTRLDRQLASPYFGRIDFTEGGSDPDQIYIGIHSLTDEDTLQIMVYDWRAPICSMFYDFETGPASYLCPAGRISGEITLKRQYRIEGGRLIYLFDSSLAIGDEILQQMLASNAGSRMRNIVSTIQKEQNAAIRNENARILAIQGAAGSGKTSVAMHRASYLLYRHKKHIKAENLVIMSSTDILGDYISNVLPELGEDEIKGVTLRSIIKRVMPIANLRIQTHPQLMEQFLRISDTDYGKKLSSTIRFKSSMAFIKAMERFFEFALKHLFQFEDIKFKGQTVATGQDLSLLFHNDFSGMPPVVRLKRMETRINELLKPLKKLQQRERAEELEEEDEYLSIGEARALSRIKLRHEIEPLQEQLRRMFSVSSLSLYERLFKEDAIWHACLPHDDSLDHAASTALRSYTLENMRSGLLGFEDAGPLLYLSLLLGETSQDLTVKHLLVDEAQDYSPLQVLGLARLFPSAGITLLGDMNQNISPWTSGGNLEDMARLVSQNDCESIELNKSYRSTREINQFASGFLNLPEGEYFGRHGNKPELILCSDFSGLHHALWDTVISLVDKKYKTTAIITRTQADARELYQNLHKLALKMDCPFRLMDEDFEYELEGIMVMPAYLAKGLEFDGVMVAFSNKTDFYGSDEKGLFYTAVTRPLHHLSILCPFPNLPKVLHGANPALYTTRRI